MRGFSLGQAGDIYRDGMRDAPLIERDTFNDDRIEVLKGSASMLFGKGSTGGVVNQVNKQPYLLDQHEVTTTIGTGRELRVTGDFNIKTGEDAALRLNAMAHTADNNGATVDKKGIAPTYRWGIGTRDEFEVGLYHLETNGRPMYMERWFTDNGYAVPALPADAYYGLASDYLRTSTDYVTFSHKHRFNHDSELLTKVRVGHYERDLLASVIGFAGGTTLANLNPNTVLTRQSKGRRAESDITQIQSDYTNKFEALGLKHNLIAGVDLFAEDALRNNNAPVAGAMPTTTVGTPNNGASVVDTRNITMASFNAQNLGFYAQDTVALNGAFKLVGGLRFDRFTASYRDLNGNTFEVAENLWSPRVGVLYQPNETSSYYASVGTSYNTSGDTYQYGVNLLFTPGTNNAYLANTPPEKSRNFEVGGKFELFEDRATLGVALFHSEKYNERNTDPDTALQQYLLSGKRHATGMEFNFAGRITPQWEVFYNHTWIPTAKIDVGATTGNAPRQGDRPGLTPKHSGSLWTTYRVMPDLRLGMGLNFRGEQTPLASRAVRAAAFVTADAMAEYTVNDRYTVKLNITNITNHLYADSLYTNAYLPGAPRAVQLTLKAVF
jgi:catecholate siderophore receptor